MNVFDFFYEDEAEQYVFYRIPKLLISNNYFKNISTNAKLLYGIMLDHLGLSIKNKWIDESGKVFIYITIKKIMTYMNCYEQKAVKLLDELETIGLIQRVHQGQGKPTKIYIKKFNLPLINDKNSNCENHNSSNMNFTNQGFRKSHSNNTELNKIEINNQSIDHKEVLKKNIAYESLCFDFGKETIDEILELMLEIVTSQEKQIKIGKNHIESDIAKSRFLSLNQFHIIYVINSLKSNPTKITNIRQYILTSLYNASTTIHHFYQAEVNFDQMNDNAEVAQ